MKRTIAVLAGDGIGPEITKEAVRVLKRVAESFGHDFAFDERLVGGAAYDAAGDCLPDETLAACKRADAVLLGAVGGPRWDSLPAAARPERRALLTLRRELGLFANLRPAMVWGPLVAASPLRPEVIGGGLDILVVRELTGGVYFGRHDRSEDGKSACDTMPYSVPEVERIARFAFAAARSRKGHVTCVDKANVLETSRLWRETVGALHESDFRDVELDFMYVDNAAMQLVRAPGRFDVLLTENMFGDILSDEASQITGSIGMLPSASLRSDGFGLYEPIHGSAPDIAGKGIANPLATILSTALLLRYSFGLDREATAVETAVGNVLSAGVRTPDIAGKADSPVSTSAMCTAVLKALCAR
jgi:3-isopropylmalate dehydrogenase